MKRNVTLFRHLFVLVPVLLLLSSCSNKRPGKPKILVFSKTAGYHHASIPDGIAAIQQLGAENGFEVDTTVNAEMFTEDTLKQYSAVVFLSTTGDVLNHYQEADFERYIQAGGGYVGIHAASDTEYHWGWYGRMVGGYFLDHPGINDPHPNVQEGVLEVTDKSHASTEFLPERWERTDEWYSFKNFNENVNVLMTIDEASYRGGADMGYHPMAWYHEYDGGRAFYTASGHTGESFSEELYLRHVREGIRYAIGENLELDYSGATTERVPEENRFTKTALVRGEFLEPTEMTILPNLDVLIAQRRGEISLFKNRDSAVTRAGYLDVYWRTDAPGVNAEEGLMGIQADPNFEENRFVYVFYSPADTSVNRLSRFRFEDDILVPESETIVLQFYAQRDICCHTGGSIAFDSEGLLYLSTGDNSTPFNERGSQYVNNGFAPLDERPGHEQYDAQRSSGNSNDLRGKILRIRVNEDGSYDIPEGNLYPKGTPHTRPEIYVQGNRNPYRISVDKKNGYLYWGEVGPDANNDSLATRGPRGYDEINQAREAGFFGWPYFVGDNYAYRRFDYATGESGIAFDPEQPVNDSPNNTGIRELPPAQPAYIWYPYGASQHFPSVGTGGRNAMAGPVYYTDRYPEETRLPDYYDGKLFIYEWVRGWIKVVTMRANGDFDKMEPFMSSTELNALIDMEVGPDGRLYFLEYGSSWFTKNPDAGLSRVDFNPGNRAPTIDRIYADKTSGTLPLTVEVRADAVDPERDRLAYLWDFGNGDTRETSEPVVGYTYEEVGDYAISVQVSDGEGHAVSSGTVSLYAGNAAPQVHINIEGNSTFYFPGQPVSYSVEVEDPDDPAASEDLSTLFVSADYVEGVDMAEASQGHQVMTEAISGKSMIESLDCQACHRVDAESIGPAYTAVAERYRDSSDVVSYLVDKIINGGSGVWGETVMPAHLEVSEPDARKMVAWIQSLAREEQNRESLPPTGTVDPTLGDTPTRNGVLILSASFTDRGGPDIKPLTGNTSAYLRNSNLTFVGAEHLQGFTTMTFGGNLLMMAPEEPGSFSVGHIDLTNIGSARLMAAGQEPITSGYVVELRLDAPDGRKIGEAVLQPGSLRRESEEEPLFATLPIQVEPVTDGAKHDLYLAGHWANNQPGGTLVFTGIQLLHQMAQ